MEKPSGVTFRMIRGVEDFVCAKETLAVCSETSLHLLSQSYDYCIGKRERRTQLSWSH